MINIYFDMDGVLCNFHKSYINYEDEPGRFEKFVIDEQFKSLEMIEGGIHLLNKINNSIVNPNISILSSTACRDDLTFGRNVAYQKTYWLEKNLPNFKFHSLNFVSEKEIKCKFATPTSILIDDHLENIISFNDSGGYGVFFNFKSDIESKIFEITNIVNEIRLKENLYT